MPWTMWRHKKRLAQPGLMCARSGMIAGTLGDTTWASDRVFVLQFLLSNCHTTIFYAVGKPERHKSGTVAVASTKNVKTKETSADGSARLCVT
jgi:hypothetical protein